MTISYEVFLARVIDEGIDAVKRDYAGADQKEKRDGAIAGFDACRGKSPDDLCILFRLAHNLTADAIPGGPSTPGRYWRRRCFALEVEWVCNCVSALLASNGQPVIIEPTARAVIKAAELCGVRT